MNELPLVMCENAHYVPAWQVGLAVGIAIVIVGVVLWTVLWLTLRPREVPAPTPERRGDRAYVTPRGRRTG